MPARTLCSLLTIALAAGCATSSRSAQRPQAGQGRWGERILVDALYLPVVRLRLDADDVPPAATHETSTGPGYGLRAAVGNADQSIGLLYLGASPDGNTTDVETDVNMLFVDFDITAPWFDDTPGFSAHAAAGFGLGDLRHGDPLLRDTTTGAANLRFDLLWTPSRSIGVLGGIGGFVLGSPGDTDASGMFLELGLRVTF